MLAQCSAALSLPAVHKGGMLLVGGGMLFVSEKKTLALITVDKISNHQHGS